MDQLNELLDQLPPEMADMLPDEVQEMIRLQKEKKREKLDLFSQIVARKRDEAVAARQQSGIETEWMEDEESYLGIDEANRDRSTWVKSPSVSGTPYQERSTSSVRSTVFLNITRPYCDSASARVGDMLLPTDDRNWSIQPTPIPQLTELAKMPVPQAAPQQPGMPPQQMNPMAQAIQEAQQVLEQAKQKAEAAQKRIEDWHIECQYHAEVRKVTEDCSRIGTGILKGPVPVKRKNKKAVQSEGGMALEIQMEICPESKRVDPWNLFPAPDCGENIHNGSYIVERDLLTAKQLKDLKGIPGYLSEQIDKVLEEGPQKANAKATKNPHESRIEYKDSDRFEVWYFYGCFDKDDLESVEVDVEKDQEYGLITIVNDTVIKGGLNPLESGEFPYDVMPWQRRAGHWAGVGVCRQIRTPQRMLNNAVRNMMDNAGISAGPQIAIWRNKLEPADGNWEITPRKIWYVREDADVRGVQDAIFAWNIPSLQAELNNIVMFALKMAEDCTGLPQLLQGSMANQAPDTVGGMQMLQNNASTVLRRIARTFDDCITEPHIRRWYTYLLEHGEDDSEKGDFVIDARGSTALVERDLANQSIMQMAGMAVPGNPFGIDPKKWFSEAAKAQKLDPKRFQYTDEEMAQMQQQPQQPPPQIAVAQIREQGAMQRKQMELEADAQKTQAELQVEREIATLENQTAQTRIKVDTDRDTAYVQSEMQRDQAEYQARMAELQLKLQLAQLDYANRHQMQIEDVRAKLAIESAKLNTQKELAAFGAKASLMAKPPTEPPGRAHPGRSYQQ